MLPTYCAEHATWIAYATQQPCVGRNNVPHKELGGSAACVKPMAGQQQARIWTQGVWVPTLDSYPLVCVVPKCVRYSLKAGGFWGYLGKSGSEPECKAVVCLPCLHCPKWYSDPGDTFCSPVPSRWYCGRAGGHSSPLSAHQFTAPQVFCAECQLLRGTLANWGIVEGRGAAKCAAWDPVNVRRNWWRKRRCVT